MMIKKLLLWQLLLLSTFTFATDYKTSSTTLKNGLKIIVCEKPDNEFVEVEVWYRVGSKDEKPGIRGMAHLFEHMMFRGTTRFPGDAVFQEVQKVGGRSNAYTSFDRTVYHQYIPATSLERMFELEADRMDNLVVTQEILNTEREVVGEEFRLGANNWYTKMSYDRYPYLYPKEHPYEVNVIGNLEEITSFTSEQCMDFYRSYYSPNNAFVVVVGNVKAENVFLLAEKHFAGITKQLNLKQKENLQDIASFKLPQTELPINFPVQIYSYTYPRVAATNNDFNALNMLMEILFFNSNSILNNRLVKNDLLAYAIVNSSDNCSLYPNQGVADIVMNASPGNVKVKKIIKEEINKIIANGVEENVLHDYIKNYEAQYILSSYTAENIADRLGMAEYYYNDYQKAMLKVDELKKISSADLKRVASKYLSEETVQVINIKPE